MSKLSDILLGSAHVPSRDEGGRALNIKVSINPGSTIDNACRETVELSRKLGISFWFDFNGKSLLATAGTDPAELVRAWWNAPKDRKNITACNTAKSAPTPDARKDARIAELERQMVESAKDQQKLLDCINYIRGIAEKGKGRGLRDDETIEGFVLGYVVELEQQIAAQRRSEGGKGGAA